MSASAVRLIHKRTPYKVYDLYLLPFSESESQLVPANPNKSERVRTSAGSYYRPQHNVAAARETDSVGRQRYVTYTHQVNFV